MKFSYFVHVLHSFNQNECDLFKYTQRHSRFGWASLRDCSEYFLLNREKKKNKRNEKFTKNCDSLYYWWDRCVKLFYFNAWKFNGVAHIHGIIYPMKWLTIYNIYKAFFIYLWMGPVILWSFMHACILCPAHLRIKQSEEVWLWRVITKIENGIA